MAAETGYATGANHDAQTIRRRNVAEQGANGQVEHRTEEVDDKKYRKVCTLLADAQALYEFATSGAGKQRLT